MESESGSECGMRIIKLKFKTVIKPTLVSTFHSYGDKVQM